MANFGTILLKTTVQARGAIQSRFRKMPMLEHIEAMLDRDGARKRLPISLAKLSFVPDATPKQYVPTYGDLHRATLKVGDARRGTQGTPRVLSHSDKEKKKTANNKQITAQIIAFIESKRWPDPVYSSDVCRMLPQSILRHRDQPEQLLCLIGRAFATLGYRKSGTGRTRKPLRRRRVAGASKTRLKKKAPAETGAKRY